MTAQHGTASLPAVLVVDSADLYHAHVRPLYRFIYSKVGNRVAAEDITRAVFVKALTHLDPTCAEHSRVAWLYRVAHHAARDYWRSGQAGAPIVAVEEARPPSIPCPTPQDNAGPRAMAILARLPDRDRTVLTLRILDGLSVAETARHMGISVDDVKVLQHRALTTAARHDRI